GDVEAIVSIGNNFFYTRSLPCHVWFFNKNKQDKDSILMIDARNTFRKVNSTINDFNPEQLEGLTTIMKNYRGDNVDFSANDWLKETFENGCYEDIEGLCKIASLDEVIENDYSLTPGRYVGFSIQIDENFDYKGRMAEIHGELAKLNSESVELMGAIQGLKL
ncbi:N-6 DNA methylase, partial [Candidatus Venteria ishoeyi]|uniref:N-6 DNA methylase n=1 Tax=Candidatus Venteria ishoeyi TaxID=1899563 RepID=UPI000A70CBDD